MFRRLLLLCASLALACPGGSGDPDASIPCVSADECPPDHACRQALCVPDDPGTGCGETGCPEHQLCDGDGRCKASGEKLCTVGEDCGGGFVCVASRCVEPCVLDFDCEAGKRCNNLVGGCVACTFDTDCTLDAALPYCLSEGGRCVACTMAGQCAPSSYCDFDPASPQANTCRPGCMVDADCPTRARCEGAAAGAPGQCVECSVTSQATDCTVPGASFCHPSLRLCVACAQDVHCGEGRCTPEGACVDCLSDADCDLGTVCEGSACLPGCRSDASCPPAAEPANSRCDTMRGQHGACIACLSSTDCPLGNKCSSGACVEGCDSSDRCPPDRPACNLIEDRCVECRKDEHCPGTLTCDLAGQVCKCASLGEPCQTSDQCGMREQDFCAGLDWCVVQVKCDADYRTKDPRCAQACNGLEGQQGTCPANYVCRYVKNETGSQNMRCVIANVCN